MIQVNEVNYVDIRMVLKAIAVWELTASPYDGRGKSCRSFDKLGWGKRSRYCFQSLSRAFLQIQREGGKRSVP